MVLCQFGYLSEGWELDVLKGKLVVTLLGSVVVMRFCLGGVRYRIGSTNVSHLDGDCNPVCRTHLGVLVEYSRCTYLWPLVDLSWLLV